jgi:flagellum-specific ATP synthase
LIRIGAYHRNTDPVLDSAIENLPALHAFLQQRPDALCAYKDAVGQLMALAG